MGATAERHSFTGRFVTRRRGNNGDKWKQRSLGVSGKEHMPHVRRCGKKGDQVDLRPRHSAGRYTDEV